MFFKKSKKVPTVEKRDCSFSFFLFFVKILLTVKQGIPILPVTKILYQNTLYLVLLINFSVISAMNPIIAEVSDT